MSVYYNEFDERAAAWLRELMKAGAIPDGEVDTRSIELVRPDDLRGFHQCHFFAGIGGWAYALQLAGWPADRNVWTGSCPCQPWSMAGKGEGVNDPRHLWPTWLRFIDVCRPATVFGEQIASLDGLYWLDLVFDALEARDYAVGAIDLPACSAGAPHGRQRLWFVADDHGRGRAFLESSRLHERRPGEISGEAPAGDVDGARWHDIDGCGAAGDLADTLRGGQRADGRPQGERDSDGGQSHAEQCGTTGDVGNSETERSERHAATGRQAGNGTQRSGNVGDASGSGLQGFAGHGDDGDQSGRLGTLAAGSTAAAGGASFWSGCDWIPCIDGKARPVESGTFPLAHGVPGRVGLLRGYGNAIVPQVAAEVIAAYMWTEHA